MSGYWQQYIAQDIKCLAKQRSFAKHGYTLLTAPFYRLGQVMLRKPGFVETNQAQDATSRKLLYASGFIFSLQIKHLALHGGYKVLLGQRGLETPRQQAHQVSLTFREECLELSLVFPPPPQEYPLGSRKPRVFSSTGFEVRGRESLVRGSHLSSDGTRTRS